MHAWIEVDTSIIRSNIKTIKRKIGHGVELIGVIKADAYGIGINPIARILEEEGAAMLAVISLEEANQTRKHSSLPILIMGYLDPVELPEAISNGYVIGLFDEFALPIIERHAERLRTVARVHLMVETGLHREGIRPEQALDILSKTRHYPFVQFQAIYSHLAEASSVEENKKQLSIIQHLLADGAGKIPDMPIHLVSSYALDKFAEGYFDAVRVGLAIYGYGELPNTIPALRLKTNIIQITELKTGEKVSYGGEFEAPSDMRAAVISIGYSNGLPAATAEGLEVLVNGNRSKTIGRVCMNMAVIDLGDKPAKVGDEVVLFGRQGNDEITLDNLAHSFRMRHHECIMRLARMNEKKIIE